MTHLDGQAGYTRIQQISIPGRFFFSRWDRRQGKFSTELPFHPLRTYLLLVLLLLYAGPVRGQKEVKKQKEKPVAVYTYNEYGVGSGVGSSQYESYSWGPTNSHHFTIGGQFTHARIRSNKAIRYLDVGINYFRRTEKKSGSGVIEESNPTDRNMSFGLLYGSHQNRLGYRLGFMYANWLTDGSNGQIIVPIAKFILGRVDRGFMKIELGDKLSYGFSRMWACASFGINLTGRNPYKKPQVLIVGGGPGIYEVEPVLFIEGNFTIHDKISIKPSISTLYDVPQFGENWTIFYLSIAYRPAYDRKKAMGFLEQ